MNDYSKLWGGGYSIYSYQRNKDRSEEVILSLVMEKFNVMSMVDFGCATGRWCKEAKSLGVTDVLGIDGEYVDQSALVIDKTEFMSADLGTCIELPQKYDLAVSLEVAEHLPEEQSDIFVENIVQAADIILFSAAIPGQGGDFHVNEQPLSYWQKKFEKHGYYLYDCLRPIIWNNDNVMPMYKQNCVVFLKDFENNNVNQYERIVDMVHPEMFSAFSQRGIMMFPFHKVHKNSKVALYGAGAVGNQYYRQLQATKYCEELFWVDRVRRQACVNNKSVDVHSLDILESKEADYYVIAIEDESVARNIIEMLSTQYKIEISKIVYEIISITRY